MPQSTTKDIITILANLAIRRGFVLFVVCLMTCNAFVPGVRQKSFGVPAHNAVVPGCRQSFEVPVRLSYQPLSSSVEDCEVEVFTSTFAEGTEEGDIILSWEPDVAEQIRQNLKHHPKNQPYIVGLVGNPGSGKTTSCTALADLLDGCMVMPFDGYHYPVKELQQMPNADDLLYRRGAPDTFDAVKLQQDLKRIRYGTEATIDIPGFDHSAGDPEPAQHVFRRDEHHIVLCEGLYLLHDDDAWSCTKDLLDYTIFVNADVDLCVERLKIRNQCIPGYTREEIDERCEVVDRANANTVERSKHRADLVVDSAAQRSLTTTISDGTPDSEIELSWEGEIAERIRRELAASNADRPYMLSVVGG